VNARVLLVIILLIVLLAVVSVVMGVGRPAEPQDEQARRKQQRELQKEPPDYARLADRVLGWVSKDFDLEDLTVNGKVPTTRALPLELNQQVTLVVAKEAGAEANSCRTLKLVLTSPKASAPLPTVVEIHFTLHPPHPDLDDPETPPALPNPSLQPDPFTKRIDADKLKEYAIPVFPGGATITLKALRQCVVEMR
jgi:hypothetical protein